MRRLPLIPILLIAIACGTPATQSDDLAAAAARAEEQGSYKMSMWMSSPVDGGENVVTKGTGAFDVSKGVGQMEMSFVGEVPGAPSGDSLGEMEALYDFREGLVAYMKWPFLTQNVPGGKEWIRMDFQELGEEMGMDIGSLMGTGQSDPSQGLSYLEGTRDVEEIGQEEVRGVQTTHYTATADLDTVGESNPDAAKTIEQLKEMTGLSEIPMEVWIDADGLPRRVSMAYDYDPSADAPPGTPKGEMTQTMEFYDYGADVNVSFPDADEVTDMAELMRQQ